jgi:hypothetical protein
VELGNGQKKVLENGRIKRKQASASRQTRSLIMSARYFRICAFQKAMSPISDAFKYGIE